MNELEAIQQVTTILGNLGYVGLLIAIVLAFYRGLVIPFHLVERMLEEAEQRTVKIVAEIRHEIQAAVKQGITEALSEVRRESFARDNKKL